MQLKSQEANLPPAAPPAFADRQSRGDSKGCCRPLTVFLEELKVQMAVLYGIIRKTKASGKRHFPHHFLRVLIWQVKLY